MVSLFAKTSAGFLGATNEVHAKGAKTRGQTDASTRRKNGVLGRIRQSPGFRSTLRA